MGNESHKPDEAVFSDFLQCVVNVEKLCTETLRQIEEIRKSQDKDTTSIGTVLDRLSNTLNELARLSGTVSQTSQHMATTNTHLETVRGQLSEILSRLPDSSTLRSVISDTMSNICKQNAVQTGTIRTTVEDALREVILETQNRIGSDTQALPTVQRSEASLLTALIGNRLVWVAIILFLLLVGGPSMIERIASLYTTTNQTETKKDTGQLRPKTEKEASTGKSATTK